MTPLLSSPLLSSLGAATPWLLWLLPLAGLPLLLSVTRRSPVPSVAAAPEDPLSSGLRIALTAAGMLAIGGLILALAGPYRAGERVTRTGIGAQISMLIDRSGSMNETFAGRQPSGAEESKAMASRRILRDFVGERAHDQFAVTAFSTAPMLVVPMTDRHDAVRAAIAAIDRPGLDYTNVARGLGMALSQFGAGAPGVSRALLLVSDGAAVIDPRIQAQLRAEFARVQPNLYWLFLRTKGSHSISDKPAGEDTPQAAPERHLDLFFKSLGVPYRAFEAEGADAVASAVRRIEALERDPIPYTEERPRRDLTGWAYGLAALGLLLLVLAKLAETDFLRASVRERGAAAADSPAAAPKRAAA
ncbi:VWA domain-containing protein [Methylorubrum populi]|uniref:VWA domain-containing protein n=1 Tax=Methylorubrum rhodesianum TaxID=29427 RepID=A0ABU9ZHG9_9HYPH|nr:vWA domain-containing protein [Methylorubrum rhodesianum]MBK3401810.1 VWA domain-containing protein [Methylorubrum rhodesianum]MBY0141198.1 VWA domain-containing protein [Methylorubrum populi]